MTLYFLQYNITHSSCKAVREPTIAATPVEHPVPPENTARPSIFRPLSGSQIFARKWDCQFCARSWPWLWVVSCDGGGGAGPALLCFTSALPLLASRRCEPGRRLFVADALTPRLHRAALDGFRQAPAV